MGVISPRAALIFGAVLTVSSIALLAATTTLLAAALAAGAIFYYAVLYTMVFKRHTRRSTEWGGVPGAAPVLIGWAAVTGSLDWPAVVIFGVVFCWQMPHFWALALRFKADYARADVPMLPVVTSELSVGRQSAVWAWLTVAVSLLLWPVGARARHRPRLHDRGRGPGRLVHRGGAPPARPDQARRRDQADAAVPRLDLVPGAAVGRDRRRRHRLIRAPRPPQRADGAAGRMGRPDLRDRHPADRRARGRVADRVGLPGRHLLPGRAAGLARRGGRLAGLGRRPQRTGVGHRRPLGSSTAPSRWSSAATTSGVARTTSGTVGRAAASERTASARQRPGQRGGQRSRLAAGSRCGTSDAGPRTDHTSRAVNAVISTAPSMCTSTRTIGRSVKYCTKPTRP